MMLAFLLAAAATPASETPKQFMTRVYAQYRNPDFSPFTHPDRYFSPQLNAAINEDSTLNHGEVGYLDGDPICQCQDSAGMQAAIARVTTEGRGKASVVVAIGWDNDPPRQARFSLVRTRAGWRIADVSGDGEPSLLGALEEANRKLKAEARK